MYYSSMKLRKWYVVPILLISVMVSLYASSSLRKINDNAQKATERNLIKFSDRVASEVIIRLDGMLDVDYVNLRTTSQQSVSVIATNLVKTGDACPNCPLRMQRPDYGELLPSNSLQVSPNEIHFARPNGVDGVVVIDVELSAASKVRLFVNGESVLTSAISKPVSWRNGKLGEGADKKITAIAYGMVALLPGGANASLIKNKDYPIVSLSNLKVVFEPDFQGMSGRTLQVALQVNNQGEVISVYPPSGVELDHEIEELARRYKFEPYLVNGRPSGFTVVINKKIE